MELQKASIFYRNEQIMKTVKEVTKRGK